MSDRPDASSSHRPAIACSGRPCRHAQTGFTLVELMVAVVIGLVLTLAVTGILTRHERDRRSVSSTNDVALESASVSYLLDRTVRSAGSGFAQAWNSSAGCLLRVSRAGSLILPRAAAFPAPFAAVPQTVPLAPVIVHAAAGANGSDVLAVQAGASALGEAPLRVLSNSSVTGSIRVHNTVGLRENDLIVVAEDGVGCVVQQIAPAFAGGAVQLISTAGATYTNDPVDGIPMNAFSVGTSAAGAQVLVLGNTAGNRPQFQLLGIGDNDILFAHDLLRLDGDDTPVPLAAGVLDLRARYGVDTDDNGVVDSWVAPGDAGWTAAELSNGTAVARTQLRRILALRIGLMLRTDRIEKDAVSPASLTLFADLGADLAHTRTLSADDRLRRTRAVEFTVPIRNTMFVPR